MSLPWTMKALKMVEAGKAEIRDDVALPELREGTVLVKTSYVALNPSDWKHIDYMPSPGATIGCEFTGTVVQLGPNVTRFRINDRIAGVVHGSNALDPGNGAFADYLVSDADAALKVPKNVSDEDAVGMNVATVTNGLALYQKLGLPMPGSVSLEGLDLLIYGGSSAMGSVAVQLAKLSGARVITACSPKNFEFVKGLGADEVLDYNDHEVVNKIRDLTHNSLHHAMDCIGGEEAAKIILDSFAEDGGQLVSIAAQTKYERRGVRAKSVVAYTSTGKHLNLGGMELPAQPEDYDLAKAYYRLMEKLLADGKVKAHPPKVGQGLEGVLEGLDELRKGRVSGVKLVYRL